MKKEKKINKWKKKEKGQNIDVLNWDTITTNKNSPPFSYLFFVNDLILMSKANIKSINAIYQIIDFFCKLSREKFQGEGYF